MRFYNGFGWVERTIDGDTFEAEIEPWPDVTYSVHIRLIFRDGSKYDAPEIKTPEGKAARDFVRQIWESVGNIIEVGCKGYDSFGRPLCYVTLSDGRDLAAVMTEAGHVKGQPLTERKFDRLYEFDERSAHYRMSLLWAQTDEPAPIKTKLWDLNVQLDQGSEGACVGFGFAQEAAAAPEVVPGVDNEYARAWYHRAKQLDPWPGEDYEGTSTLAGAKVGVEKGNYVSYLWARTEEEVARTVSNYGPVVIGVNWYRGMMDPDEDGFIWPTGDIVGGHCIVIIGINVKEGYYILQNSWGRSWGTNNGCCYLMREHVSRLLSEDGDMCVLTRVHIDPDPVPPAPPPAVKCSWWTKFKNWLSGGKFECPKER